MTAQQSYDNVKQSLSGLYSSYFSDKGPIETFYNIEHLSDTPTLEINKSYDNIKQSLSSLYSSYADKENVETFNNIEHFSMGGMPRPTPDIDVRFKNEPLPQDIKDLNIVPSELYNVIEKFDLEPSRLNDTEKGLRIKYLDIAMKVIDNNYQKLVMLMRSEEEMKRNMQSQPVMVMKSVNISKAPIRELFGEMSEMSLSSSNIKLMIDNAESAKRLTVRIINLLKTEINPTKCPDAPVCPTCPAIATCPGPTKCPDALACPTCAVCPGPAKCPDCPKCPKCPKASVCPGPTICPDCPTCPDPIKCPGPTICPDAPKCPTCPDPIKCPGPTICPDAPKCPTCPDPIKCPGPTICPDAPKCPTCPDPIKCATCADPIICPICPEDSSTGYIITIISLIILVIILSLLYLQVNPIF
jgi:hypothetical protein